MASSSLLDNIFFKKSHKIFSKLILKLPRRVGLTNQIFKISSISIINPIVNKKTFSSSNVSQNKNVQTE